MTSDPRLPAGSVLSAKAPVWVGLRTAAEELPLGAERRLLLDLARQLEAGESLSGIAARSGRQSPLMETVQAGIESGRFVAVLEEYLRTSREVRDLWRAFWGCLLYPAVFLLIAVSMLAFFLVFVSQNMKSIFYDFGVSLPGLTFFLITVGDLLFNYWPLLLVLFLLACLSPWLFLWFSRNGDVMRVLQAIPLVGSAARSTGAAEFCRRLAVLIDARLPLPRALEILSGTLRSGTMREVAGRLSRKIAEGKPADRAAEEERQLPPQIAGVFGWTETPEVFSDGLRMQSQLFTAQSRLRLAQLTFLLEPLTFICLALGAGMVVLGFFLPLTKLLNDLS